jgi:pyridoxal phosphate enzyme (YggS family)
MPPGVSSENARADDGAYDPAVSDLDDLADVRARILRRIAEAAARSGRDPSSVEVVAVTKTVPPARIRAAIAAGFTTFGENRVQERQAKAPEVDAPTEVDSPASAASGAAGDVASPARAPADRAAAWHLIGPLQSNKARRAVELFDVIETVGSLDLAARLSRLAGEVQPGRPVPVLLQVNVDADAAKSGFEVDDLERDLPAILDLPELAVGGLMTVGRLVDDPELARPTFVALRAVSERLRARHPGLGPALSMGMSDDYPVAIEEGATLVRVGRAIFGARPSVQ